MNWLLIAIKLTVMRRLEYMDGPVRQTLDISILREHVWSNTAWRRRRSAARRAPDASSISDWCDLWTAAVARSLGIPRLFFYQPAVVLLSLSLSRPPTTWLHKRIAAPRAAATTKTCKHACRGAGCGDESYRAPPPGFLTPTHSCCAMIDRGHGGQPTTAESWTRCAALGNKPAGVDARPAAQPL